MLANLVASAVLTSYGWRDVFLVCGAVVYIFVPAFILFVYPTEDAPAAAGLGWP